MGLRILLLQGFVVCIYGGPVAPLGRPVLQAPHLIHFSEPTCLVMCLIEAPRNYVAYLAITETLYENRSTRTAMLETNTTFITDECG